MDELRKRFGRLVAANRKKAGMTQSDLATASQVSVDMISRIEVGATGASFTTIDKLAAGLGVDPAELFTSELTSGGRGRTALADLTARLAMLSDRELTWVAGVLEALLKPRA